MTGVVNVLLRVTKCKFHPIVVCGNVEDWEECFVCYGGKDPAYHLKDRSGTIDVKICEKCWKKVTK